MMQLSVIPFVSLPCSSLAQVLNDEMSVTSTETIFQLWRASFSQLLSTVVCIISVSTFLTCLNSYRQSTSSCNTLQRYSMKTGSQTVSIGVFQKTLLIGMLGMMGMIGMMKVEVHHLRLTCNLFKRDHDEGGVGVMAIIRARSTG